MLTGTTDGEFLASYTRSDIAVRLVARWFERNHGYRVTVPPLNPRPTRDQADEYSDRADMFIDAPWLDNAPVEVKWRVDVDFTGALDFPYPTIIVQNAERIEGANGKPPQNAYAYVIVGSSSRCGAIIFGRSIDLWRKEIKIDRRKRHIRRAFYVAPLSCATWIDLPA